MRVPHYNYNSYNIIIENINVYNIIIQNIKVYNIVKLFGIL